MAVYGDQEVYEELKKYPGSLAVLGGEKLLPAHRYVFFGEEQENLDLYLENRENLEKKLGM